MKEINIVLADGKFSITTSGHMTALEIIGLLEYGKKHVLEGKLSAIQKEENVEEGVAHEQL